MLGWIKKRAQQRRFIEYLKVFPEDAPIAKAIVASNTILGANSAKKCAEILLSRPLLDHEWDQQKFRWERAWNSIIGKS